MEMDDKKCKSHELILSIDCLSKTLNFIIFQATCNRFDHNHVLHQWLLYRRLSRDFLEESLGPCKGNASDRDSRRRKLHLGPSCDTNDGVRFKPIAIEEGFLFSAEIMDDGLMQNYSDQDYIHNHKKLD